MKIEKDFVDLLKLFNDHKVRFCIVGAFAYGFHARPRYTKDLDILVDPAADNAQKIIKALGEFGLGDEDVSPEDLTSPGKVVQLGLEPVRIDLLNFLSGVSFEEAWENRKKGLFGDVEVCFLGLDEIIKNKKATKRAQDIADLEQLEKIRRRKGSQG